MKIATSSASFERLIAAGDITQLEWIDWCATSLETHGIVPDARHFPRTDDDYLAQVKKLATDLCLTIAAVRCDTLLSADADATLALALAVGAPIVLCKATPAGEAGAWNELVAAAKGAAGSAKRCNVTLAIRSDPQTLCPDAASLKRLAKDVDSAWLRFAIDPDSPEVSDPLEGLLSRAVIAAHDTFEFDAFGADVNADISGALRTLPSFNGFFVVDYMGDYDVRECVKKQLRWVQTMLAKDTLERV